MDDLLFWVIVIYIGAMLNNFYNENPTATANDTRGEDNDETDIK